MPFQPNDRGVVSQECTPMLNPCQHRGQLARRGKVNDANHRNHPHQNHPPAIMFATTLPDTCNGTGLYAQQPVRDRSGTNRTVCRSVGGGIFFTAAASSPTILCRNGCCRQDRPTKHKAKTTNNLNLSPRTTLKHNAFPTKRPWGRFPRMHPNAQSMPTPWPIGTKGKSQRRKPSKPPPPKPPAGNYVCDNFTGHVQWHGPVCPTTRP